MDGERKRTRSPWSPSLKIKKEEFKLLIIGNKSNGGEKEIHSGHPGLRLSFASLTSGGSHSVPAVQKCLPGIFVELLVRSGLTTSTHRKSPHPLSLRHYSFLN